MQTMLPNHKKGFAINWLFPLRQWLNHIEIRDRKLAHWICQLIPAACPFQRDINLWGHVFHIPALCKLNPLYDELMGLRFRALTYLSEFCAEDIALYLH